MNNLLFYILKSTIGISLLYGGFRLFMRKETFFALNRAILLAIVLGATAIPLISLPTAFQPIVIESKISVIPQFEINPSAPTEFVQTKNTDTQTIATQFTAAKNHFPWVTLVQYLYWAGILISFLMLIHGIGSVLILFRKAQIERIDGFKLVVVDHEVSPFSFARIVVISRTDYENHRQSILTHELAHIRLNHFIDLALLESIKIVHWFNPFIYLLISDMKEIHEFQADENTLNSGIDAKQYQFLIIQKSVGAQRFALANSFNHCQIKKRITMMNKSKTSKAWRWKVATFLPLLALLLMAFSKTGENVLSNPEKSATITQTTQEPEKQWTEADFGKMTYNKESRPRVLMILRIQLNSKSQLVVNGKFEDWEEASKQILKYLDYNSASEEMKPLFDKIMINRQERMAQKYTILNIIRDVSTPVEKYQNLLNFVGNVVMETRQKYANEIYKTSYQKLTQAQRDEIIKLIPAIATFDQYPILAPETQANKPSLYIEVRAEGIFVLPDKNVVTIDEMKQKAELFAKENGSFVDIRTAAGLKDEQVSQVKEALKDIKLSIRYLTFDPVYVVVEQMAEFPGGVDALKEWITKNLTYPEKAKATALEGKVYVNFVINSKGKAVFPKVARGLSPELDREAIDIISKMPDWQPAIQNGIPVSVSYTIPINFSLK